MSAYFDEAQEFIAGNGGDMVLIAPYKWVLRTGATIEGGHGLPARCFHPPRDPKACLTLRRKYHAAKLKEAEGAFNHLKGLLTGEAGEFHWDEKRFGPRPSQYPDGTATLIRLKEIVHERRRAVKDIDDKMADLPEERLKAERERELKKLDQEAAAHRAERDAALRAAVAHITLNDGE